MSSSVSRSPVMSSATTLSAEKKREISGEMLASPSSIDIVKQIYGVITEVHSSLPMVKVYNPSNGTVIGDNRWIPLIHSIEEIVERYGTIRIGMGVLVITSGPGGSQSMAQVISNEQNRTIAQEEVLPNTVELGLWEIFTPGSGL